MFVCQCVCVYACVCIYNDLNKCLPDLLPYWVMCMYVYTSVYVFVVMYVCMCVFFIFAFLLFAFPLFDLLIFAFVLYPKCMLLFVLGVVFYIIHNRFTSLF